MVTLLAMDAFILVVGAALLVVGSLMALAWWHLARRAVPYGDEREQARKKAQAKGEKDAGQEVVVIDTPRSTRGGEPGAR